MKTTGLLLLLTVPLLFSCLPKKPEIPLTEAPAGPLVQSLAARSRSFSSLRALGSMLVARKDRRQSFDSVGVLLEDEQRFKIEAYGPLGESAVTVLWDGKEVKVDAGGERHNLRYGSWGLARVLGSDADPAELAAALSGNVPGILAGPEARLFCAPNGSCTLELKRGTLQVRMFLPPGWSPALSAGVPPYEVYHGKSFVFRAEFGAFEEVSGYLLPRRIVVLNGERGTLTIEYAEADVNIPLNGALFAMPPEGGGQ